MDAQLDGIVAAVGLLGLVHWYRTVKIGDLLGWLAAGLLKLTSEFSISFTGFVDPSSFFLSGTCPEALNSAMS